MLNDDANAQIESSEYYWVKNWEDNYKRFIHSILHSVVSED
jgi:hypothetical protein